MNIATPQSHPHKRGHGFDATILFPAMILTFLFLNTGVSSAVDRPNIVVIVVDDMGYSDLGCYGSEIATPHIDALAAGGVRFTQFYNTAKCFTTRASLLTGLYHQQVLNEKILNRKGATIAEVLRNSGYQTLMSGKWHLNGGQLDNPEFQPPSRGFDHFFGTILGAGSFFKPYTLQRGYERITPGTDFYYTDAITDDAVAAISQAATRGPFFHYVCFTAPHWPMHIPDDDPAVEKYKQIYRVGWDTIRIHRFKRQLELGVVPQQFALSPRDGRVVPWQEDRDTEWQVHRMAVYAAMVERMDRGVGRILSELKTQKVFDNTLVLFLSDNGGSPEDIGFQNGLNTLGGDQFTRDGRKIQIGRDPSVLPGGPESYQGVGREWANVNNVPFRQFKAFSHEGGIATPMIAHWPAGITNAGAITSQVGHVIDVMPTCLEAAGVVYPNQLNGHRLLPCEGRSLIGASQGKQIGPRTLFWEYGNHCAVREGDWKLVALSTRDRNWELYDMSNDRTELDNLIEEIPDRAQRMAAMFDAWAMRVGVQIKQPVKKTTTKTKVKPVKTKSTAAQPVKANSSNKSAKTRSNETATKSENSEGSAALDPGRILYQNEAYTLRADSITEGDRHAHAITGNRPHLINSNAEMVRPNLERAYPIVESDVPLIDLLYKVALADLEMNIVEDERGTYFRVSPDFPNMIFTRDTAYSSYLGACYALPDVVTSHLKIARSLRRQLRFKCPEQELILLPGVENEPESLSNFAFYEKYGTNAYARRTDDPCWVIGYWAALCAQGDRESLPWLIAEFEHFDKHFYRYFFDESDGLYHGQASFIDIGGTGYPPEYSGSDSILVKALSTNCLYVGAFDRIARASELVGDTQRAAKLRGRADALRTAIRQSFKHPEGYYAYFKDVQGRLQNRREQLGMAFAVLFDVLPPGEFGAVVDNHPVNDFGSPVLFPFYHVKKVYHNNAIWPFADTLYHRALIRTHRDKEVLLRTLGNLSRNALWGNFTEIMDYETGGWQVKHARSYIWSAAAYLSVIYHMIVGIDSSQFDTVTFAPYLPAELGASFRVSDLHVAGMTLDIQMTGNGSRVHTFTVDGTQQSRTEIRADGGQHTIVIELE